MRQGQQQNRRGRGRGGRKPQNALARSYESNGPDVKIRGTASHIAEKYMSLARDALASGDMVTAESYLQHAEHYNRIIMAALLRRHDDAVVVLGVLEITLGGHHVAGGQRVARERHVFLGDVRSGPADLHVGAVRFVAPRQCILGFTATTAAAPAILLLSLPHMPSSPDWRLERRVLRSLSTLVTCARSGHALRPKAGSATQSSQRFFFLAALSWVGPGATLVSYTHLT